MLSNGLLIGQGTTKYVSNFVFPNNPTKLIADEVGLESINDPTDAFIKVKYGGYAKVYGFSTNNGYDDLVIQFNNNMVQAEADLSVPFQVRITYLGNPETPQFKLISNNTGPTTSNYIEFIRSAATMFGFIFYTHEVDKVEIGKYSTAETEDVYVVLEGSHMNSTAIDSINDHVVRDVLVKLEKNNKYFKKSLGGTSYEWPFINVTWIVNILDVKTLAPINVKFTIQLKAE